MARFDAVVLAHVEASQSGVAAAALGHGLPVIATPSGGVVEQIDAEKTGIFASEVSAEALADAMSRFVQNPELRRALYRGVSHLGGADNPHSMERFFEAIVTDPGR
jgi:glycosyltransferase involved in cell wall biosynthesis